MRASPMACSRCLRSLVRHRRSTRRKVAKLFRDLWANDDVRKRMAEDAIENLIGVKDVANQLRIGDRTTSGSGESDQTSEPGPATEIGPCW